MNTDHSSALPDQPQGIGQAYRPTARLFCGDCLETLAYQPSNSIDAIVTDPPYALVSITKRFGKPGAAPARIPAGGSGAYARASSGFMGQTWDTGETAFSVDFWLEAMRVLKPGGHVLAFGGTRTVHRLTCAIEDAGFEIRDMIAWLYGTGFPKGGLTDGRGVALKPALEPITLARKPLIGSVAANTLAYGTGALNIDGCRTPMNGEVVTTGQGTSDAIYGGGKGLRPAEMGTQQFTSHALGRFPANVIHDGSDEVEAAFLSAPGQLAKASSATDPRKTQNVWGAMNRGSGGEEPRGDTGSAARFFYSAKASKADRGAGNTHPTVKPTALMRYLCRLITPPGGTVLDPFMGSGSTGKAALAEGFNFVGIEREQAYFDIARGRIVVPGPFVSSATSADATPAQDIFA